MAYKVRMRKDIRIGRVITKIASTLVALWAGGLVIQELGQVMLGECSPFFRGLTLIGWDVGNNATATNSGAGGAGFLNNADVQSGCASSSNIVYNVGDAGVLAIVGLVGLASIVLEFVEFKM